MQIVGFARRYSIDLVLVTDHESHLGSLDCQVVAGPAGPVFPLCAEYRSTSGDLIAAFLTSPIASRDPLTIIEETHRQGGVVLVPHPYKNSRFADAVFERADLIEIFNARCSDEENSRAQETATALAKPGLAGPDAHFARELGLAVNIFTGAVSNDLTRTLLDGNRSFEIHKTTKRRIRQSQMLKAARLRRPISFVKNAIRWLEASHTETP